MTDFDLTPPKLERQYAYTPKRSPPDTPTVEPLPSSKYVEYIIILQEIIHEPPIVRNTALRRISTMLNQYPNLLYMSYLLHYITTQDYSNTLTYILIEQCIEDLKSMN